MICVAGIILTELVPTKNRAAFACDKDDWISGNDNNAYTESL